MVRFLCLILAFSCFHFVYAQDSVSTIAKNHIIFHPTELVDFNAVGAKDSSDIWNPDLQQIERGIQRFRLTKYAEDREVVKKNLSDYFVQIVGIKKDTIPCIFYNFVCRKGDDLNKHIVWVMGGGQCYFQILYSIPQDSIIEFSINAPK